MTRTRQISVFGAREHNLKAVNATFRDGRVTVVTGLSGSGKSSLAFDTVFAEGQRRYVESLSAYARQFLAQLQKPAVDRIEGLCPTIAIQQRVTQPGPRSTVATSTDIFDYLRVLFARVGVPHCWRCQAPIHRTSVTQMVDFVLDLPERTRLLVLAPLVHQRRGAHRDLLDEVLKRGFVRVRVNGETHMIEDLPPLPARAVQSIEAVVDRIAVKPDAARRIADSVETALTLGQGRILFAVDDGQGGWRDQRFSAVLACPDHEDVVIGEVTPQSLSFNTPAGACSECHGLGTSLEFEPELVVPDDARSVAHAVAALPAMGRGRAPVEQAVQTFCRTFDVAPRTPVAELPPELRDVFLAGGTGRAANGKTADFEGIIPRLRHVAEEAGSDRITEALQPFRSAAPCAACGGSRLSREARSLRVGDRSLADVVAMTVERAADYFDGLSFAGHDKAVALPLVEAVTQRTRFLREVGVAYLTLDRAARSLSGGEWQRMRLATQIGGALSGVCYVLDEPTVGLHARDSRRLATILRSLADMDNTVIVVEHDEEIIRAADDMIEVGPGAGDAGGRIVAEGDVATVLASDDSITGRYLSGKQAIPCPASRRPADTAPAIKLLGVRANNLRNVDVRFPLGCLVCVTGVSGSGKSTLVNEVLFRALSRKLHGKGLRPGAHRAVEGADAIDKAVQVDQSPIGRTPRSTPATYVGALDALRKLYARTREAKIRGYAPKRFSFNVRGGRCETCEGQGVRRVSMHFLPDVFVTCDDCGGRRFNRETLEIRYRGKTVADVLDMQVSEAVAFFDNIAAIKQRLRPLEDVGLGYLKLGQASSMLSGGEAQRIKLAAELYRADEGRTLYVLDEPTTGLHYADVERLLAIFQKLVDAGQSIVVIEHHLDVVKCADWVIDIGPEGGEGGGEILAEGPPETITACARSHTGRFLAALQARHQPSPD